MKGLRLLFTLVVILLFSESYAQELKIAFGSCYEQDKYNLPIWQAIQSKQPDMFIFCLLYTTDAADE